METSPPPNTRSSQRELQRIDREPARLVALGLTRDNLKRCYCWLHARLIYMRHA